MSTSRHIDADFRRPHRQHSSCRPGGETDAGNVGGGNLLIREASIGRLYVLPVTLLQGYLLRIELAGVDL